MGQGPAKCCSHVAIGWGLRTVYRLSGFDAAMLSFESLAGPLTAGSLWQLDWSTAPEPYSFERFRDRIAERIPALPEFRMKLADSRWNPDTPVWVDDPDFDIDRHVHRVQLPAPGSRRDLMELCGSLLAQRMDRSRPLWDIWAIEGIAPEVGFDGGVAVMHRFHHSLADGDSAFAIFARLCSTVADPPPPQFRPGVGTVTERQLVLGGIKRFAARPWRLFTTVVPVAARAARKTLRPTRRGPKLTIKKVPRTPFNGNISERRGVAYCQLDLTDVKTVKDRFGGTVNDVVLAVVSAALRRFLLDRAALPDATLVAGLPVALRANPDSRNNLSGTRCPLYTDIVDPVDRLKAIATASSIAKQRNSEIWPTMMLDLCEFAPGLLTSGMWLYRWTGLTNRLHIYNASVSHVRPPDEQYYLAGAAVRARFTLGAVFNGGGLAIIVNSLYGKLNIGMVGCGEKLPHEDIGELAGLLQPALQELLDRVDSARTACG